MADRFYSVTPGEGLPSQVAHGGSSSGEPIELRINDTAYSNKLIVIEGVKAILAYLMTIETNPIA